MNNIYTAITTQEELNKIILDNNYHFKFKKFVFNSISFEEYVQKEIVIDNETKKINISFQDCIFFGCILDRTLKRKCDEKCLRFPQMNVPFKVFHGKLYSKEDLFDQFINQKKYSLSYDKVVYDYFTKSGSPQIYDSLARNLHDHSILSGVKQFIRTYPSDHIIAIMGGHSMDRTSKDYKNIVDLTKELTENGNLIVSGGGPGAMEASHVGSSLAGYTDNDVNKVLEVLSKAPSYTNSKWLSTAFEALDYLKENKTSQEYFSLGVPTWKYGHEPPTPFATHIAKFFDNSIREDLILSIPKGGIVYTPGSAGTLQEIFQDAVQNHYITEEYISPMIFYNSRFWTNKDGDGFDVYSFLKEAINSGKLNKKMQIFLVDSNKEILEIFENFQKNEKITPEKRSSSLLSYDIEEEELSDDQKKIKLN